MDLSVAAPGSPKASRQGPNAQGIPIRVVRLIARSEDSEHGEACGHVRVMSRIEFRDGMWILHARQLRVRELQQNCRRATDRGRDLFPTRVDCRPVQLQRLFSPSYNHLWHRNVLYSSATAAHQQFRPLSLEMHGAVILRSHRVIRRAIFVLSNYNPEPTPESFWGPKHFGHKPAQFALFSYFFQQIVDCLPVAQDAVLQRSLLVGSIDVMMMATLIVARLPVFRHRAPGRSPHQPAQHHHGGE